MVLVLESLSEPFYLTHTHMPTHVHTHHRYQSLASYSASARLRYLANFLHFARLEEEDRPYKRRKGGRERHAGGGPSAQKKLGEDKFFTFTFDA